MTPYAYVVPQGDQIWLNYINLFVDTIKLDGRLLKYAKKNKLDPIVAPYRSGRCSSTSSAGTLSSAASTS